MVFVATHSVDLFGATFCCERGTKMMGGWATLRHSPVESPIESSEVAMAKSQMRSNREKKMPKQDRNKEKRGEAPSSFAVKLGTSYKSQYGKKH